MSARGRSLWILAAAALLALVVIASSSAIEVTIAPGVGIGKVRMGMTRAQVERVLGRDALLDARTTVAGTSYVEYGWDFGSWSVGFLRRGSTLRVAQVAVALRAQRTGKGIGVGSTWTAVLRAYPQAICRSYYVSMRSTVTAGDKQWRGSSSALVVARNRRQLAFLMTSPEKGAMTFTKPWYVYEVIVRNSVPGAVDYVPQGRCRSGWQQRGYP